MSKGTPITTLRIPPDLMTELLAALKKRNENSKNEPLDKTGFILAAIREKLAKMQRSRTRPCKCHGKKVERVYDPGELIMGEVPDPTDKTHADITEYFDRLDAQVLEQFGLD